MSSYLTISSTPLLKRVTAKRTHYWFISPISFWTMKFLFHQIANLLQKSSKLHQKNRWQACSMKLKRFQKRNCHHQSNLIPWREPSMYASFWHRNSVRTFFGKRQYQPYTQRDSLITCCVIWDINITPLCWFFVFCIRSVHNS